MLEIGASYFHASFGIEAWNGGGRFFAKYLNLFFQ